jgi:hypothetical protein
VPADTSQRWFLERGCIRIADLVVCYPQRSIAPDSPLSAGEIPRSYGILPTAEVTSGGAGAFGNAVIGAVAEGEVVWLGFRPTIAGGLSLVRVRVEGPKPLDALTGELWVDHSPDCLSCPPNFALPGIRQGQVYEPFGRAEAGSTGAVQRLTILAHTATGPIRGINWRNAAAVQLVLVRPINFTALTGSPPEPLNPDDAYKGWRLP